MADDDQTMRFGIATPRPWPLPDGGGPRPSNGALGAGVDPMRSDAHAPGGAGGDSLQIPQAQGLPSTFQPVRERYTTPIRSGPLTTLRAGSSPPERDRALSRVGPGPWRQRPNVEQFWAQYTEDALRVQNQRCEEVAASYVLETKQAFLSEKAAWQRSLLAEEQRMAAHGRHEAVVQRDQIEHQLMQTFGQYARQQSSQLEQAAHAERQYLANAA